MNLKNDIKIIGKRLLKNKNNEIVQSKIYVGSVIPRN